MNAQLSNELRFTILAAGSPNNDEYMVFIPTSPPIQMIICVQDKGIYENENASTFIQT